jgi:hypothetical protein
MSLESQTHGHLAEKYCNKLLPLAVLKSAAGYYIGTADEMGPVSRESNEYWRKETSAQLALGTGNWSQKAKP